MAKLEEAALINTEDTLEALRLWHGGDPPKWPLSHLRLWLQAAHDRQEYASLAETGPAAQTRAVLTRGLEIVKQSSPEAHDLLRARFEHRRDVMALSNQLNVTEQGFYYRQRRAIKQLTDALIQLELEAGLGWQERMLARLDLSSYSELVGVEEPRSRLRDALLSMDDNFITAVAGLGGIGKTALADQVVRDLTTTTRFEEIAWVTAKQTHLSTMGRLQVESGRPALTFLMLLDMLATQFGFSETEAPSQIQRQQLVQRYLRERACLVVIDNLETVADYRTLLPDLRPYQRPTKFLLTSRVRLLDQPDVFVISLEELPASAAFKLIRLEAHRSGFAELERAGEAELQQIYNAVGGNPLALKLIARQLRFYSLPQILERFAGDTLSHTHTAEGLFDYIYEEIWRSLKENDKEILLALTEAGETGFPFSHLASLVVMAEEQLGSALEELILLSLVDVGGSLFERRYRLHRLTELFLLRRFGDG